MSDVTAKPAAPLDEMMLAMDVVDTLRHRQDLALRELNGAARERQLIEKLREIYHHQGIEVPGHILKEGVAALAEARFTYEPPRPGWRTTLARLYVSRGSWGKPALALLAVLVLAVVAFFGIWQPFQRGQQEAARIELAEGLPAQLDALYETIYQETKVQQAVLEAEALRTRGQSLAAEGDRAGALQALDYLTALRDLLRQEYRLVVVNQSGVRSAFWTFPEINTAATNYYIVVQALDADGDALQLPIRNEENGATELVDIWAVRVPETVYTAVLADKQDDGIIQANEIGRKSDGFLEVEYNVPVMGGALTQW
ncbi:MAG TPA: DUF6384 family protein [Devosia sp.]|nr:DUF6384 family protein [Devosia sp.]